MDKGEDLFSQAYRTHVLEEDDQKAINLCRKILDIDPSDYRARVFLGMLLGDQDNEQNISEARTHFRQAIEVAENADLFRTTWPEEAVVYHLGLWEWKRGNACNACIFFLLDYMISHNKESLKHFNEVMAELDPTVLTDVQLILNRINQK